MLYVVDSVTRRWIDQAKQQGQTINSSAPDGTYAAGVHRVTELIPVLMNDVLHTAPDEQKVRYFKHWPVQCSLLQLSLGAQKTALLFQLQRLSRLDDMYFQVFAINQVLVSHIERLLTLSTRRRSLRSLLISGTKARPSLPH